MPIPGKSSFFTHIVAVLSGIIIVKVSSSFWQNNTKKLTNIPTEQTRFASPTTTANSDEQEASSSNDGVIALNISSTPTHAQNISPSPVAFFPVAAINQEKKLKFIIDINNRREDFNSLDAINTRISALDTKDKVSFFAIEFSRNYLKKLDNDALIDYSERFSNWLPRLGAYIFSRRIELADNPVADSSTEEESNSGSSDDTDGSSDDNSMGEVDLAHHLRNPILRMACSGDEYCGFTKLTHSDDDYILELKGFQDHPTEYLQAAKAIVSVLQKPENMATCKLLGTKKMSEWFKKYDIDISDKYCPTLDCFVDNMTRDISMVKSEIKCNIQALLVLLIFEELGPDAEKITAARETFLRRLYKEIEPSLKFTETRKKQRYKVDILLNGHRKWLEKEFFQWTKNNNITELFYHSLFNNND